MGLQLTVEASICLTIKSPVSLLASSCLVWLLLSALGDSTVLKSNLRQASVLRARLGVSTPACSANLQPTTT